MISNWTFLGLIEKWDESAAVLISGVFVTSETVDSPKVF